MINAMQTRQHLSRLQLSCSIEMNETLQYVLAMYRLKDLCDIRYCCHYRWLVYPVHI